MQSTTDFTGLSMPVFTAFGWAGEETAIKFALSQLEIFISQLHANLPREVQDKFPHYGLSEEHQAIYLSAKENLFEDVYVAFYARPMSLEMQLSIQDRSVLKKAYKQAEKNPAICHRFITELGPEWVLRIQQLQVDEDSGESSHYQDIFKDSVAALDEDTAVELFEKIAYLNDDARWEVPFSLTKRFDSERVAAMGQKLLDVMSEQVSTLMPLVDFMTGKARKKRAKRKKKTAVSAEPIVEPGVTVDDLFIYTATLKPLHLRRGFINLTPKHWPFFQINSRTETRPVTLYYEGVYDKKSAMWRLQPNNQARLVLSPTVHEWLEDNFEADDQITLTARKLNGDEIQISLKPAAETTE